MSTRAAAMCDTSGIRSLYRPAARHGDSGRPASFPTAPDADRHAAAEHQQRGLGAALLLHGDTGPTGSGPAPVLGPAKGRTRGAPGCASGRLSRSRSAMSIPSACCCASSAARGARACPREGGGPPRDAVAAAARTAAHLVAGGAAAQPAAAGRLAARSSRSQTSLIAMGPTGAGPMPDM
jgi:hypothetical protein